MRQGIDHEPGCPMRICESVNVCPCCDAKIYRGRPRPWSRRVRYEQELDAALRKRPPYGCDVDGNLLGIAE